MGIVLSLSLLISLAGCGDIATQSTNGSGSATVPANMEGAPADDGSADGASSPSDAPDHGSHEPPTAEAVFPGSPHAEHIGQLSKQESADALTALNVPFPTGDIDALVAALRY